MKLTELTDYQESLLQALPPARQRWNRRDMELSVVAIRMYEALISSDDKEQMKSYLKNVLEEEKQKLTDLEIALSDGLEFQKARRRKR